MVSFSDKIGSALKHYEDKKEEQAKLLRKRTYDFFAGITGYSQNKNRGACVSSLKKALSETKDDDTLLMISFLENYGSLTFSLSKETDMEIELREIWKQIANGIFVPNIKMQIDDINLILFKQIFYAAIHKRFFFTQADNNNYDLKNNISTFGGYAIDLVSKQMTGLVYSIVREGPKRAARILLSEVEEKVPLPQKTKLEISLDHLYLKFEDTYKDIINQINHFHTLFKLATDCAFQFADKIDNLLETDKALSDMKQLMEKAKIELSKSSKEEDTEEIPGAALSPPLITCKA